MINYFWNILVVCLSLFFDIFPFIYFLLILIPCGIAVKIFQEVLLIIKNTKSDLRKDVKLKTNQYIKCVVLILIGIICMMIFIIGVWFWPYLFPYSILQHL
jgi:hypothetical protein